MNKNLETIKNKFLIDIKKINFSNPEIITFLGNVGSGKTTLLKTLEILKKIYNKFNNLDWKNLKNNFFKEKINFSLGNKTKLKIKKKIIKAWYDFNNPKLEKIILVIHIYFEIKNLLGIIKEKKIIRERDPLSNFFIFTLGFFKESEKIKKIYFSIVKNLNWLMKDYNYFLLEVDNKILEKSIKKRSVSKEKKEKEIKNLKRITGKINKTHEEFKKIYFTLTNSNLKILKRIPRLNKDLIFLEEILKKEKINFLEEKKIFLIFNKILKNDIIFKKIKNLKKTYFLELLEKFFFFFLKEINSEIKILKKEIYHDPFKKLEFFLDENLFLFLKKFF